MCAYDEHFNIPWGHGRGFMNGSDATPVTWWQNGVCSSSRLHSYYTYYIERTLFGRKVITYKKTTTKNYSTEYAILDAAKITIWHSVFFFPLNKYARMHFVFQSVAWHCVFTDEQLIIHQFSASQSGSVHNKCCSTNSISVSLFSVWVALMCI